jgi:hypothetical protein
MTDLCQEQRDNCKEKSSNAAFMERVNRGASSI